MIISIIDKLFLVYTVLLFIRIFGSWLPELNHTRFMQFIAFYTDPYLNFFRRFIPPLGLFDLSPIVAFFCLSIMENMIKAFLMGMVGM